MDQVIELFGRSEIFTKAENLIVYGASAVLVTFFVNWALSALLIVLKPFACAGILLAIFRPEWTRAFVQKQRTEHIANSTRVMFLEALEFFVKFGEQCRSKLTN